MRLLTKLACLSLLPALSACADGYYDNAGNYHPYNTTNNPNATASSTYTGASSAASPAPAAQNYGYQPPTNYNSTTTVTYSRAGFYDRNGYFIATDAGPHIPAGYYPPAGMCRVWFPERPVNYQPPVEACDGIQYRVPAGAYVVYGG